MNIFCIGCPDLFLISFYPTLPLPVCEVLTVQSGAMLEKTTSDSIVSTHYGPLTLADVDLHTFQFVRRREVRKKMQIVRGGIEYVLI